MSDKIPSRRALLGGLALAIAAPAVIRTPGLLMPVRKWNGPYTPWCFEDDFIRPTRFPASRGFNPADWPETNVLLGPVTFMLTPPRGSQYRYAEVDGKLHLSIASPPIKRLT